MKRGLGCIFRLFLLLITLIIVVFFIVYAVAPVYEFPAPTPFSGKVINNPYHKLDTALWRKGNFQVQSKVWMGLTDGRKNEAKAIYAVYHQLDYDVVAITDYMKINRFEKDKGAISQLMSMVMVYGKLIRYALEQIILPGLIIHFIKPSVINNTS